MWMILHVDSFWHRDKRQIAYYQVPEIAIMILIAKYIAQRIEEIIYPGVERCIFEFFAFVSFSFSFLLLSRWILSLLLFVEEASSQPAAEFSETDERYLETLHSLLSLRAHVREIEDANMCAICLEKARNVAFMCGHGTCVECATSLEVCPMCRKPIEKKITLFNWSKCFYGRVILRTALFWGDIDRLCSYGWKFPRRFRARYMVVTKPCVTLQRVSTWDTSIWKETQCLIISPTRRLRRLLCLQKHS